MCKHTFLHKNIKVCLHAELYNRGPISPMYMNLHWLLRCRYIGCNSWRASSESFTIATTNISQVFWHRLILLQYVPRSNQSLGTSWILYGIILALGNFHISDGRVGLTLNESDIRFIDMDGNSCGFIEKESQIKATLAASVLQQKYKSHGSSSWNNVRGEKLPIQLQSLTLLWKNIGY